MWSRRRGEDMGDLYRSTKAAIQGVPGHSYLPIVEQAGQSKLAR